jgi:hypothetical protein
MSQHVIERVTSLARIESADVNRVVLTGIVPAATRTFAVITPHRRKALSKMFFTRQQRSDSDVPERWNIYGRWIWFFAAVYLTSPRRGEILLDHFESVTEWLRETAETERPIIIRRGFWTVDEDTACLRAARTSAKALGDEKRVLELTRSIQANEREIAELQRVMVYQTV